MEKAALIEICPASLRMTTISLIGGTYYKKTNQIIEPLRFDEDIFENQTLSMLKFNECVKILNMFRELCKYNNIVKTYCVVSSFFSNLKNVRNFIEEIQNKTSLAFNVLNEDEEAKYTYNAIYNTVEPNKAIMLYINPTNTIIMHFSKRNIISTRVLNFGANTLAYKFKDYADDSAVAEKKMLNYIKQQFSKLDFEFNLDEIGFIGAGESFLTLSKLVRKMTHYPLDNDNNFVVNQTDFLKAFKLIGEYGFDKTKRLANISNERLDNIFGGFVIVKAFFEQFNNNAFHVASKSIADAIISAKIIKENANEIFADVLENSLNNLRYYHSIQDSNADWVYNFTMNLFKQTSIIHKLNRKHMKPLRIATMLYDCGKRIDFENHPKYSKEIILNSKIYGVSHRELVIAAFACQCQNLENFKLSEWIKFNKIVNEDDMIIARKIGTILKLSESLDYNKQQKISDVNCDILGDIVIIKVKGEGDISYEISQAEKVSPSFKKVFNKNFQII